MSVASDLADPWLISRMHVVGVLLVACCLPFSAEIAPYSMDGNFFSKNRFQNIDLIFFKKLIRFKNRFDLIIDGKKSISPKSIFSIFSSRR